MLPKLMVSFVCPKCNKECRDYFHEVVSVEVSAKRYSGDYFGEVSEVLIYCGECREETSIHHGYE